MKSLDKLMQKGPNNGHLMSLSGQNQKSGPAAGSPFYPLEQALSGGPLRFVSCPIPEVTYTHRGGLSQSE